MWEGGLYVCMFNCIKTIKPRLTNHEMTRQIKTFWRYILKMSIKHSALYPLSLDSELRID